MADARWKLSAHFTPANNRWSILKCPTKAHQTRFSAKDDGNSICGTATKESGLFLSYLGVDHEVFCMDDDFDAECFKAMMSTLKIDGFKPIYWKKGL